MNQQRNYLMLAVGAALILAGLFLAPAANAQGSLSDMKYQFKVGVLPFVDNTGTGSDETGGQIGRAVQAELAHSTDLEGRVLNLDEGVKAEDMDEEKAVEMGRTHKVDVVLVGTVIEATTDSGDQSVSGPSVFGQSIGGSKHSQKSVITLQGDLFNTTTGKKIESIRVTGKNSSNKVGANASTTLGSIGSGALDFDNSTLGKAFHDAVGQLVKKVVADEGKMVRYSAPANAPSPNPPPNQ
jgi:hypothetical protein